MGKIFFFYIEVGFNLIDLSYILSINPYKYAISLSGESYDENTPANYRNCYVAEKRIVSKLSQISSPNFDSTN